MAGRDIIVLGASAGGVEALAKLVQGLPSGFPASLFIACHFPAEQESMLPEILSRAGPLLAGHARDHERFVPGHIYVAPPDYHLVLARGGNLELSHAARENGHRPAIDPLFRSAARYYGSRVIGVVLSGALTDGVAGLLAIRSAGGVAVVQDPADARVGALPQSASNVAGADHIVPVSAMAPLLVKLVAKPISEGGSRAMDPLENMPQKVNETVQQQVNGERQGDVSFFTCPECGGALWQVEQEELVRFRCHVGHAYYGERLLEQQAESLEAALWIAVRTFRERAVLSRQLAHQERARGNGHSAERFEEQAQSAERHGELIQKYVLEGAPGPGRPEQAATPPVPHERGQSAVKISG
jgi:two-component system chemotaxis response regulator CheB